jgi:hypothetical protein
MQEEESMVIPSKLIVEQRLNLPSPKAIKSTARNVLVVFSSSIINSCEDHCNEEGSL